MLVKREFEWGNLISWINYIKYLNSQGLGASARLFELRDQKPMIPLVGGIKKENVEKEITYVFLKFFYGTQGNK